jgi:hypothetical protein
MKPVKYSLMVGALVWLGLASLPALAAKADDARTDGGVVVGHSYQNDVSLPLYYLPAWSSDEDEGEEGHEGPDNPQVPRHHVDSPDPVVQHLAADGAPGMPPPILNFDGIVFPGVGCNCAPPDPDGEVGETQFVQMVNEGVQVFDKATGSSVMGPVAISSLWAGFGGVCESAGHGDPIVLYDQLANRWLISQFAGNSIPTDECIAISTTSDAAGSYYRYGFHFGSNFFDYPHIGVWPDAYYMSMNIFNSAGTAYFGPQVFAFDRPAMIAGDAGATFVTFPSLGSSHAPLLPADLDGDALPPAGAPGVFVETPDTTYPIYHLHADFVTPTNSTFALFESPAAAGYTALCPGNRSCVPQSGGEGLDGIGDRLMFRLAYRNFGDHESLIGNFTVKSSNVAGIRWFELRNVITGPADVYQESTYQPDSDWRWLGSVAMDSAGNMAVGFSASGPALHPQLRYAGRLAADPLNTLAQGEEHLFDGAGSQASDTRNRWGDYSALSVDPVDDCTFWYTNEYYQSTSSFNWRTRIGNFKFDACGTPGFTLNAAPQDVAVCAGSPVDVAVDVGQIAGFNDAVSLSASGNPAPSSVSFTPNPVQTLPGTSTMTVANTAGVADGQYPIQILGSANGADDKTTTVNLSVFSTAPPAATLTAPADGATNEPLRPAFSWTGSNTQTYTLDIATDSAFSDIVFTTTVTGTSATPDVDLASNTQFYWRVSAANACGSGAVSATFTFTTQALPGDCSTGTTPQTLYSYGFESGISGWSIGSGSVGNTWAENSTAHSGAHSWKANDTGAISDQRFVSPAIALPTSQIPLTLQFWHKRDMEPNSPGCFDGGILEVSTDSGASWTQVSDADLLTDPYNGPVSDAYDNPLANLDAWCDVQDWTDSIVDVSAYGGQTVQFRFRLGSDESVSHDGWYVDDVKLQSCSGGSTVTHVVTPSAGAGGSITPSTPQTVTEGDQVDFTLTADNGFAIDSVGGTCGGNLAGNLFTTDPVTADCTVIASFVAAGATHTVTPSVGTASGTITPSTPQTVNDGDTIAFTLAPATGFQIDTVGGTCGGSLAGSVFTTNAVTADCTVIANFTAAVTDGVFCDGFEDGESGSCGGGGGSVLSETFDDITTLPGDGWVLQNNSDGPGSTEWFQSDGTVFNAQDGSPTGFIGANFNNTDGGGSGGDGTISNWLVTPLLTFDAASSLTFYTRSTIGSDGVSVYPDRIEVRLCTGTPCTNVGSVSGDTGDFGTLLRSVNPNLGMDDDPLGVTGYPLSAWSQFTVDSGSGLPTSGQGRIAFRYFVTEAGPSGLNSNYIGIDTVDIHAAGIGRAPGAATRGISPAHRRANGSR